MLAPGTRRFGTDVYLARLQRAAETAAGRDIDALLVTPSPDYAYLLGYAAPVLERLTCLIVRASGSPVLVVPRLEATLARHELEELADHVELLAWDETDDPFALVARALATRGGSAQRVAVEDQMWARFVLRLQAALTGGELVEAREVLAALRRRKSPEEIERLRYAAESADAAIVSITSERLSGRTEAEVQQRIRGLLVEAGHQQADFAIVASGPNSASPHHIPGDRRIEPGDAVVLDIGGTRDGYGSDTTRTAFVGQPPDDFRDMYRVLHAAQQAAFEAIRPGVPARDIDRAARGVITEAGHGEAFIHRTGHGIGMETHEEPYIVESNAEPMEVGDAFSIEPGIYYEGMWGARIEDIVICTETGGERLNRSNRELYIVE